jgi:hypothetical protein
MGPAILQSLEEKDKQKIFKLGLKYMYYHVHCTFVEMYILDFKKFLSKMFCSGSVKYSELCLAGISQKSQPPPPPPIPPKKSIGARPYGFKNLYSSKKPATVTQQLQKSIDFRRIELYDFHLWFRSQHPPTQWNLRAADEAVLTKVQKMKIFPCLNLDAIVS